MHRILIPQLEHEKDNLLMHFKMLTHQKEEILKMKAEEIRVHGQSPRADRLEVERSVIERRFDLAQHCLEEVDRNLTVLRAMVTGMRRGEEVKTVREWLAGRERVGGS